MIKKSEILNIYYRARGFSLQLKIGWRGVLELADLFRLRTRTFEAKNCQAVSADAVFCFLNIFLARRVCWINKILLMSTRMLQKVGCIKALNVFALVVRLLISSNNALGKNIVSVKR